VQHRGTQVGASIASQRAAASQYLLHVVHRLRLADVLKFDYGKELLSNDDRQQQESILLDLFSVVYQ